MSLQKYEFNQITIPSTLLLYLYLFKKEVMYMEKNDFYELMREQERKKREAGAESTADLYRAVRNRFFRFCRKEAFSFKELRPPQVADFMSSLRNEGLHVNTVNSYISCFRAMYNKICRKMRHKPKIHPFEGIRLKREETVKRAVTVQVMEMMAGLDYKEYPEQAQAAGLALFSFMACGMPFVDLVHLTKDNIQEGGRILTYHRQKTGTLIQIQMSAGMKYLIDRYASSGSPYLFPLLSKDTSHEQYKAILAEHNRQLKKIGEHLNLPGPLTSYVFRHTWASEAYRQHIAVNVISQALGHTSEKMTHHYLARLDSREIGSANDLVINKVEKLIRKEKIPLFMI